MSASSPGNRQYGGVLAGVKAKPCRWPTASLDTGCGRRSVPTRFSPVQMKDPEHCLSAVFNDLFSSNGLGLNSSIWNTIFSSGVYMPGNWIGILSEIPGLLGTGTAADGAAAAEGLGGRALLVPTGGLGGAVSAALGRGTVIGALAVPPSWDVIAPTTSPIAPLLGGAPISAPPAVPGMPGMPATSAAGNHFNGSVPKYGFRPTVVAHSPAAG